MDEHKLLTRAQKAFKQANALQHDMARASDLNHSSESRALRNACLKHTAVQARIVSLLENVLVERRSTYEGKEVQHQWVAHP